MRRNTRFKACDHQLQIILTTYEVIGHMSTPNNPCIYSLAWGYSYDTFLDRVGQRANRRPSIANALFAALINDLAIWLYIWSQLNLYSFHCLWFTGIVLSQGELFEDTNCYDLSHYCLAYMTYHNDNISMWEVRPLWISMWSLTCICYSCCQTPLSTSITHAWSTLKPDTLLYCVFSFNGLPLQTRYFIYRTAIV